VILVTVLAACAVDVNPASSPTANAKDRTHRRFIEYILFIDFVIPGLEVFIILYMISLFAK
jgi:hypothetical protein